MASKPKQAPSAPSTTTGVNPYKGMEINIGAIERYSQAAKSKAFTDFVGYMKSHAPTYSATSGRRADLLDFVRAPTAEMKARGFKDFTSAQGQQSILAEQLRQAPVSRFTNKQSAPGVGSKALKGLLEMSPVGLATNVAGSWSDLAHGDVLGSVGHLAKTIPGVGLAEDILGGGGDSVKHIHLDHPQAVKVIQEFTGALQKAGLSQNDAFHAMAENVNPKTKKLDLKKIYQSTAQAKTAAAIAQVTSPKFQIDQFLQQKLDPQQAQLWQQKIDLYNQFQSYWGRKEAGLKGKRLGANPLTGYTRTYLGIPTGQPITPQLFFQALKKQQNDPLQGEFDQVASKFKEMGISSQIQKMIQLKIQQDKHLPRTPSTTLKGLFTQGQIDMEDVLQAYLRFKQDPNAVAETPTGGQGVLNTAPPDFKSGTQ